MSDYEIILDDETIFVGDDAGIAGAVYQLQMAKQLEKFATCEDLGGFSISFVCKPEGRSIDTSYHVNEVVSDD